MASIKVVRIDDKTNGVLFVTYGYLIRGLKNDDSNLGRVLHWCDEDFVGVLMLDKCHKAKSSNPDTNKTSCSINVLITKLHSSLPNAWIVYYLATKATKHITWPTCLGLPYEEMEPGSMNLWTFKSQWENGQDVLTHVQFNFRSYYSSCFSSWVEGKWIRENWGLF